MYFANLTVVQCLKRVAFPFRGPQFSYEAIVYSGILYDQGAACKSTFMLKELIPQFPGSLLLSPDIEFINVDDLLQLIIRFGFHLPVIFIVVHFIYAKNSRRKDFYFSYFAIAITIFTLCFFPR